MKFMQILFNSPEEADGACIGLLGGGGKTALLNKLGEELAAHHSPVMLSSLTKAGISESQPLHLYSDFEDEEKREELLSHSPLYIMSEKEDKHKLIGIDENQLEKLHSTSQVTVFECDGARKRPIKAHQPHDPMIPGFSTHAIIIVGADAVGAKIDAKLVHRPELFRELWDVNANYELEPSFIAKVVTSKYGYMQKVPLDVKFAFYVNKADAFPAEARDLAKAISRLSNAPVFYGSLEKNFLEKFIGI